ncbi:DUF4156 domain-containing protein [Vibrio mediterranei]|uniref:DUF4156 domain-containing protein n=1 Tax=Vibrio mediterranei TaxID=689 RepID=A0AAN1KLW8_9VIBR|nr:DUF4156 domain-containing protein [Vibrio mediterranei]ASI88801.1 hypothetical protein BSZ05_02605 [Vibrio mediterranei]
MLLLTKRGLGALTALVVLQGCSTPANQLSSPQAERVEVRLDATMDVSSCAWKGDITGSEGRWYSSIFYGNDALARGAMNDIKNHASELEADTVLLLSPLDFQTSVTLIGSAYRCKK